MTERYVHVVWCDDIRQEVGNKPSLMGVYTGGLVVPGLPFTLGKLIAMIWVVTPVSQPIQRLKIKIVRDDGFILSEIPGDALGPALSIQSAENPLSHPETTSFSISITVSIAGLEIPADCKFIQVIAETESESMEGGRLWFDVNPNIFGNFFQPPLESSKV